MDVPRTILCEHCGGEAFLELAPGEWAGVPVDLPSVVYKPEGTFAVVLCPNCGRREQNITPTAKE
jgi:hypothetical protein